MMTDKEHKLNNRIYMIICQWICKVHKRGFIVDSKDSSNNEIMLGNQRHRIKTRLDEYKFTASNTGSFFLVIRTGILTNQLGRAESLVLWEVTTLIGRIFNLDVDSSAEMVAKFFIDEIYIDMFPSVMHEQLLYHISNDYEKLDTY